MADRRESRSNRPARDSAFRSPINAEEARDELHSVLDEGRLDLAFQPIVDLRSGALFGYEALARARSTLLAAPPDLYAAAVETGRVGELGRAHREQVAEAAPQLPIFVNINPNEFDHRWLVQPDDPLYRHRAPVYLEITESAPLSHFEQCRNVLEEIRKRGILLAVDDLGSGYSNLKYIAELAPDVVKIDRELVAGVRNGTRGFRLLDALVRLVKAMGARAVIEGIETQEELSVAKMVGADLGQGYLFGKPAFRASRPAWTPSSPGRKRA